MCPGLSDVRTTPHCLVRELSNDDFPTFDLPKWVTKLSCSENDKVHIYKGVKNTYSYSSDLAYHQN